VRNWGTGIIPHTNKVMGKAGNFYWKKEGFVRKGGGRTKKRKVKSQKERATI